MTTDTTDPVEPDDLGIDLTAWEAPPMLDPHLADDVIAKLRPSIPAPNPRRRMLIAAGALVAAAAIGGLAVFGIMHASEPPTPPIGAAATSPAPAPAPADARVYRDFPGAAYPQKVQLANEIGLSEVDLEVNAGFRAAREGHDLWVVDARGEASWNLGGGDRLHIALGKTAGFGLMIEATGGRVVTRIHTRADEPIHVEVVGVDGARVHAYRGGRELLLTRQSQTLVIDPPGEWKLLDDNAVALDPFATCDDHRRSADRHMLRDETPAQLAELEAAYKCDQRSSDAAAIVELACTAHDEALARKYYVAGDPEMTAALVDCRGRGIELAPPAPARER